MFEGSFYHTENIRQEAQEHCFEIILNPRHPVYAGHFPGQPVVPGVCSLQMIRECASRILGKPLSIRAIQQCKFLSPILPDRTAPILIRISLNELEDGGYALKATTGDTSTTFLNLKATLI